jgi:Rab3 GTPase-activating protein catalytic subunit
MPSNADIDLSTCVINKKLHMLAICIAKKRQQAKNFLDGVENKDESFSSAEEDNSVEMNSSPRVRSDGFDEERDR